MYVYKCKLYKHLTLIKVYFTFKIITHLKSINVNCLVFDAYKRKILTFFMLSYVKYLHN